MYFILIFLLIITIITITIYLFAKSSSVTKSSSVCKDNQKFLNNSCCDLTRIYTDNNIEKCCQKDLCNKMCCGDTQICDSTLGCQNTYDCNGYDCIITKGGKYTEPTCGSKCPKRPTPSSSSSGSNTGTIIVIVVAVIVLLVYIIFAIYGVDLSKIPIPMIPIFY